MKTKLSIAMPMRVAALLLAALLMAAPAASANTFERGFSLFQQHDYRAALEHWLPLAEQGDARAQYWVAFLLENGTADGSVEQDQILALKWYLLATAGGYALADERGRHLFSQMPPKAIDSASKLARQWVDKHQPRHFAAPIP